MGAGGSCCRGAADDERVVTKMDLSHCGCTEVPPIVFQAERYVETLNLSHNRILSLPPQLFHCQELKHLNLIDNGLDSLPPAIGSLLHLVSLKLDKNCIKDLPENLKNCRKLKRLSVSNNQLGQLPAITTQLIGLEELYLNDCDLTYLPASVGRLSKLRVLELRNNRLTNLPLSMTRLTTLTRLDVGDNSFQTVAECIVGLTALQELLFDNNELEALTGVGIKRLEYLDASYNNLRTVGKDLGQCAGLTLLNLGWNYIETLPESVGNLTLLECLVLEMNELSTLPRSIGQLVHLQEMNIANNRLCDLPVTVGLLRNLTVLNMSRNYVEEFPSEIGSCLRISIINASYNRLQSLPSEIGYLTNLKVLDVVGNFLMYLPISMSNLTDIRAIWLSANQNVPLIPFTEELSVASGERFLTNIALPQLGETALPPPEPEPVEKSSSWRRKIRFEEDDDLLPGRLDRTPTPFPKELRCPTRKQRQEDNYVNVVDGRVAVFQQVPQDLAPTLSFSDSSVTMIREANIRKNREAKPEETNENSDNHMSAGVREVRFEIDTAPMAEETIETLPDENQGDINKNYPNDELSEEQKYPGEERRYGPEPIYVKRIPQQMRQESYEQVVGKMSPISEEEPSRNREMEDSVKPDVTLGCDNARFRETQLQDSWRPHEVRNGSLGNTGMIRGGTPEMSDRVDGVDVESIDSFEAERHHFAEANRNQVIYSNLRNGNPYPPGYFASPQNTMYKNDVTESHVPYYNNLPLHDNLRSMDVVHSDRSDENNRMYRQGIPNGIRPPVFPARQSPYGMIRQSPHLENGNIVELERPPSKQEMLVIAERNRSQNISPPCYEIAKLYSTKAALFENYHKKDQQ